MWLIKYDQENWWKVGQLDIYLNDFRNEPKKMNKRFKTNNIVTEISNLTGRANSSTLELEINKIKFQNK